MNVRPITPDDFELILKQDRRIYPTDSPVTRQVLSNWYAKNPQFGMIFEENGKIVGDFIVIPLNKEGWEKLINGNLAESGCKDEIIFDNSRDKELGIHAYHIEKIEYVPRFSRQGLTALGEIVEELRMQNSGLRVVGFSGLAVTRAGINLAHRLGFRERDYICPEHIMKKQGKLAVVQADQVEARRQEGYNLVNRCEMRVLYPENKSVLWDYVKST